MTFTVNIKEVHTIPVKVEAKNANEAIDKVIDLMAEGKITSENLRFEYTMDSGCWTVEI